MQISTGQSVREAEQRLFAGGQVSSLELMNTVIDRLWNMVCGEPLLRVFLPARVVVYAGTGNNAGDAIGLAARFGCPVTLRCAGALAADAAAQLTGLEEQEHGKIYTRLEQYTGAISVSSLKENLTVPLRRSGPHMGGERGKDVPGAVSSQSPD